MLVAANPHTFDGSGRKILPTQSHLGGSMPTALAKLKSGQSIGAIMDWARDELEGLAC
ncbi:MAG TPA: hypothetical protein VGM32_03115 [Rhodopila sp.]|jgi:hypothetical protein